MPELMMPTDFNEEGVRLTPREKRIRRLRNYAIGLALVAFVVFVYVLTWIKIANKSF